MARSYSDQAVHRSQIDHIIDAALRSPSAGNTRGQRLVVVTDPAVQMAIAEAANERSYVAKGLPPWLSSAPVIVAVGSDESAYRGRYAEQDKQTSTVAGSDGSWTVPWWWVDAGATIMTLLLAAEDEGMSAGFLGAHACPDVASIVGFGPGVHFVGLVTIGHPTDHQPRSASLDRQRPGQVSWLDGTSADR